ncbi:WSD1 family O-acyltransferase [Streptomyces lomondensis]|nr:hypothetical protein [Streptomyces lomondensis]MCF0075930.1 WSD1 family O-acyltransferase [Streptomyces lomondensis]
MPEELRALGRSLDPPGTDGSGRSADAETMVERVLGQILAEGVPVPVAEPDRPAERLRAVRRWTGMRWRSLTATLCGLLTVLVLTPPVRATVLDWFDFGGVEVRYAPSATPSSAEVPGCPRPVSLAEAERRTGFRPLVPPALGTPDAVTVTRQPQGRYLTTLCWRESGGTIRLDEYPARLGVEFVKTVPQPAEWVPLDEGTSQAGPSDVAVWLPRPHLLSFWLEDAQGDRFLREERPAGPTLLWTHGGRATLRLEGVASKERAAAVARSLR